VANKLIDYWYAAKDVLTTGRIFAFNESLPTDAYWRGINPEKAEANLASWNADHAPEKSWQPSSELNAVEALSHELPKGYGLKKYDGITTVGWEVARDLSGEVWIFDTREEAIAWAIEDNNHWLENEEPGQQWEDLDADQERLEHERGDAARNWSRDHAELERREFDQETHSERSRSEEPERGIEDDEELGL
jgi:hypothetical protein